MLRTKSWPVAFVIAGVMAVLHGCYSNTAPVSEGPCSYGESARRLLSWSPRDAVEHFSYGEGGIGSSCSFRGFRAKSIDDCKLAVEAYLRHDQLEWSNWDKVRDTIPTLVMLPPKGLESHWRVVDVEVGLCYVFEPDDHDYDFVLIDQATGRCFISRWYGKGPRAFSEELRSHGVEEEPKLE